MSPDALKTATIFSTAVCFGEALTQLLLMLAEHHGNREGPWLDDVEVYLVDLLKNTPHDQVSWEDEIKIVEGSVSLLRMYVNDARQALS